jgi:hypothetical protein
MKGHGGDTSALLVSERSLPENVITVGIHLYEILEEANT